MRILFLLIAFYLSFFNIENAKSDALLTAAIAFHLTDWLQTREIAKNKKYYEKNIILGKYPSTIQVDAYMLSSLLTMLAIDSLITKKHKSKFRVLWAIVGASYVRDNYLIGIRVSF